MSACRSCGTPIWWARTTKDRRIPIDVEAVPVGAGNLIVVTDTILATEQGEPIGLADIAVVKASGQGYVISIATHMVPEAPRWRTHFATCPQANQHRKR